MKRSSQTEKKVFSSANGFEKRPAAKKNCADYGFCAAQIFIALTTAVSLLFAKKLGWNLRENMLICIMTSVLLFSPWLAEHVLRVSFPPILKLLFMLLIMGGPIFGKIYKFYYIIPFWDKSLHVSSGFLFAVIGAVLPDVLDSGNKSHSHALKLVSALSFTLAIAAVWEFYEYAMDTFFGMDMQQDTIVSGINSYLLGSEKGVAGSISDIQSVIVNGEELSINGYLDIGLIDTMQDMLVCTFGGICYCVCFILCEHGVKLLGKFNSLLPYRSSAMPCFDRSGICSDETGRTDEGSNTSAA